MLARRVLTGLAAGAAGTTALNTVTYLDMVGRGRPASDTPAETVRWGARSIGVEVPGDADSRENRTEALGALSGIATGLAVGAVYGVARQVGLVRSPWAGALVATGLALAGSNGPMTAAGITDPRTWSTVDWASDVVPHLAFGAVVSATFAATEDR